MSGAEETPIVSVNGYEYRFNREADAFEYRGGVYEQKAWHPSGHTTEKIRALSSLLPESSRDAERLNFLIAERLTVIVDGAGRGFYIPQLAMLTPGPEPVYYSSARDAIDAAISSRQEAS